MQQFQALQNHAHLWILHSIGIQAEKLLRQAPHHQTIYCKYLDDLEKRIKEVKEKEELKKLRPPVDGNEIMKILKIEPGPSLGKIMESLYEQRINEGEVSKEEAIKLAKEVYKKL